MQTRRNALAMFAFIRAPTSMGRGGRQVKIPARARSARSYNPRAYGRSRPSPENGSSPEWSARVRSVRGTFLAVVTLSLAGQLCAVAYEVAVAGRLGTGSEADALALGLTLVVAVANEIVTWISILFAPQYIEARLRTGMVAATAFLRATAT